MTPLRALMCDQMTLRHLSERTKSLYVSAIANLAGFYHKSPDRSIASSTPYMTKMPNGSST